MNHMFTILDKKAQIWSKPSFDVNKGSMSRNFSDVCNDPQSMLNRHPYDYDLYYLGEFDSTNAQFNLLERPEFMFGAFEMIKESPNNEPLNNETPIWTDPEDIPT